MLGKRGLKSHNQSYASDMINYRKGANEMEEMTRDSVLPVMDLPMMPENFLWMQVKGGTKVTNVVTHARNALQSGEHRVVVWSGCGPGGVGKTISCAEIIKRDLLNLHQVTRLCYQQSNEYWEPIDAGLDRIVASRKIPCIHIMQSLDEIPGPTPGHQVGQTDFWEKPDTNTSAKKRPKKRNSMKK